MIGMEKTTAIIRRVGDKFCVFSHDGKNLGCSNTREGAVKRLQQVEYFKHQKGSTDMANYEEVFENLSIADMKPEGVDVPSNKPSSEAHRPVDITSKPQASLNLKSGTVAGNQSPKLLDQRDHFPVITETQARASMARVMQLGEIPAWYSGSLDELRYEVYAGVMAAHPGIELKVSVPVEKFVKALSDGEESATTQKSSIKNPEDKLKSKVPQKPRPALATADIVAMLHEQLAQANLETYDVDGQFDGDEARQAFAADIVDMLSKQKDHIDNAMALAKRLMKKGMSGEEFASLVGFLQSDILSNLLVQQQTSGSDRRAELLARLQGKKND